MKSMKLLMALFCFVCCGFMSASAQAAVQVALTEEERAYLQTLGPVKYCADPDWYPYEQIDPNGDHQGIAADLLDLIAQRLGIEFEPIPTKDWEETVRLSKAMQCDVVSLLNQTPDREAWLTFTDPYFSDPAVLITREEHDYVTDLKRISNETVVLPEGTSVEERLRQAYPNIEVLIVPSELEAMRYVSTGKADFTIRSQTMAAYTIRKEGLFNLKIAGHIPEYTNNLCMGVNKNMPLLRNILNKGIATLTPQDVNTAINRHIAVEIVENFDYRKLITALTALLIVVAIGLVWIYQLNTLNRKLRSQQRELTAMGEALAKQNAILNQKVTVDPLTGILNRYTFDQSVHDVIAICNERGDPASILLFDLDKFKEVNDTHGHDVGDQVLIRISACVERIRRKQDIFARWGGEEFVILMRQTCLGDAVQQAETIRAAVEKIVHPNAGAVTVSVGAAQYRNGESVEEWFRRTDQALYRAKKEGRNRVWADIGGFS